MNDILQQVDWRLVVAILGLLFGSGWVVHIFKRKAKTTEVASIPENPSISNSNKHEVVNGVFSRKVRIKVGDYIEIHREVNKPIRISTISLDRANLSDWSKAPEIDLVKIYFNNGGGLFYCGPKVRKDNTNSFSMPQEGGLCEEERAVYNWTVENWTLFFRCLVDHINTISQEVDLDIHYVEFYHKKP